MKSICARVGYTLVSHFADRLGNEKVPENNQCNEDVNA
jgi:hypothetical protein